jgi:SAM-dependent methyltransferase
MVDETRRRVRQEGLLGEVDVRQMGIHEVDRLAPASFDVALSNFGPLNCVPDLAESARLIADRLVRGGTLVASVIGRVCPWELALYSVRGNPARARLRFSRSSVPVPLNGEIVWTRYYGVREFTRAFRAAGLTRVDLRALGVFVPPPYMDAFAARHPRLIAGAERLDDAVGRWPGVRACGDHFLIVMVKR